MTATPAGKRIIELESIRGVAALLVVLHHMSGWNTGFNEFGLIKNGYLMVELFFVLSGFVIFRAYSGAIRTPGELARFQFLRFGRLYPVHCLFLGAFLAVEILKYIAAARFGISSPNSAPFRENNPTALIEQLFLLQSIGPTGNAMTFNFPAWSISTEFYTYLIFAIATLLARRWSVAAFALLSVISLATLSADLLPSFELLLRCTTGFFLGCVTAALVAKARFSLPPIATVATILVLLAFLQWKPYEQYNWIIYFLTAALIICVVLAGRGAIRSALVTPVLTWLGTLSYSVYMAHGVIVWTTSQVLRFVLKRPELLVEGRLTPQLTVAETILTYAIVIPIVLLVAQIVYWWIEKPMRERSRQFAATYWGDGAQLRDGK